MDVEAAPPAPDEGETFLNDTEDHNIGTSPKQTPVQRKNMLRDRISIFDNNNKAAHLPVKPVVVRKPRIKSKGDVAKPEGNEPEKEPPSPRRPASTSALPSVSDSETKDIPVSSQSQSTSTLNVSEVYERPLAEASLSKDNSDVPTRIRSVQDRLFMFEKKNKEILDISAHSNLHPRRISSVGRMSSHGSGGTDGLLSPRWAGRPTKVYGSKLNENSHFISPATPGHAKFKSGNSEQTLPPSVPISPSECDDKESDTVNPSAVLKSRRSKSQLSDDVPPVKEEHIDESVGTMEPDELAGSNNSKRSWRVKTTRASEVQSSSEHTAFSADTFHSASDDEPPKRSWKVKGEVPVKTITSQPSLEDSLDDDEQEKDKSPKRSWKPKVQNSLDTPSFHEAPLSTKSLHGSSTAPSWKEKQKDKGSNSLDVGSCHARTSSKLMDRINMFSANPAPTSHFLGSKYRTKLVAKEAKSPSKPASKGPEMKGSNHKATPAESSDSKPKESLDVAQAQKKKVRAKTKNKSIILRDQMKHLKGAAPTSQKKKEQNVFINAKKAEDFSAFQAPEFVKDEADRRVLLSALRKNFAFDEVEENDLERIVTAMEQYTVDKDTMIVTQGEKGDYFYAIVRGEVTFLVDGKKVGSAGPCNSFGELSLLYSSPRAASVRADTSATLFRLDQKTFRFMMQSQTKKSEEERKRLLRQVPFFTDLSDADINRLYSVMQPILFSTGDYIVRKGDHGNSFFLLQDGRVRLTEIFVGGTSYEDLYLGHGDYFGEDALISDEPRPANVVALTKGTCFSIERACVQKMFGDFGSMISKAQDRQRLESIKIFRDADLTSSDFDKLAKLIQDKSFDSGITLFEEGGEFPPIMYFVREGSVRVSSRDGGRDEVIGAGGTCGRHLLLAAANSPVDTKVVAKYSATVTEACVCGVLSIDDCRSIFDVSSLGDHLFAEGNTALEKKRSEMRNLMKANIKMDDLDKDRIIGEGQFGTVWLVRADPQGSKDTSKMVEFAMKVQFKTDPVRKDGAIEAIKREMTVVNHMNHPFIIDLVDSYETEDQIMMLTEAVKGGELWSRIHQEDDEGNWTSGIPEQDSKFYALVIADTIAYMHRQKFIFRDLKPENVLIDLEGYPTLCDFGFAKYCPEETSTFCGTPNYLAPEIVLNRGHGAAVDHWALAIVTYEMITGENPFYFDGQDQMALLQAIVQEAYYPLPKTASPEVVDFVTGLLEKDPVQRLGSTASGEKGILKHDWFKELDINMVRNKKAKAPYIPKPK
eukprot:Nitzschia sp. Nitz4//scaffold21_size171442//84084//87944//NITZ4_002168-RA/size171442-augustus-gene-0.90-mRNA-1//-1//CDS//3329542432//6222//frame0